MVTTADTEMHKPTPSQNKRDHEMKMLTFRVPSMSILAIFPKEAGVSFDHPSCGCDKDGITRISCPTSKGNTFSMSVTEQEKTLLLKQNATPMSPSSSKLWILPILSRVTSSQPYFGDGTEGFIWTQSPTWFFFRTQCIE